MFRSQQCVFLGYSAQHKGVKCLDVSTSCVHISGDVVFDETQFPFAKHHPNAGALLRKEILLLPSHLTGVDHVENDSCDDLILINSFLPGWCRRFRDGAAWRRPTESRWSRCRTDARGRRGSPYLPGGKAAWWRGGCVLAAERGRGRWRDGESGRGRCNL